MQRWIVMQTRINARIVHFDGACGQYTDASQAEMEREDRDVHRGQL